VERSCSFREARRAFPQLYTMHLYTLTQFCCRLSAWHSPCDRIHVAGGFHKQGTQPPDDLAKTHKSKRISMICTPSLPGE